MERIELSRPGSEPGYLPEAPQSGSRCRTESIRLQRPDALRGRRYKRGAGIEPCLAGLEDRSFALNKPRVMPPWGIEPHPSGLKGPRSTSELQRRWSSRESNPLAPKGTALQAAAPHGTRRPRPAKVGAQRRLVFPSVRGVRLRIFPAAPSSGAGYEDVPTNFPCCTSEQTARIELAWPGWRPGAQPMGDACKRALHRRARGFTGRRSATGEVGPRGFEPRLAG